MSWKWHISLILALRGAPGAELHTKPAVLLWVMDLWFKGGRIWATWDGYNIFFRHTIRYLNSHTPRLIQFLRCFYQIILKLFPVFYQDFSIFVPWWFCYPIGGVPSTGDAFDLASFSLFRHQNAPPPQSINSFAEISKYHPTKVKKI